MMMSIFSSFDALSGEFFGQKVNKLPSGLSRQANSGDSAKLDGGKSSSSPSPAVEKKRQEGEGSHQEGGKRRAAGGPRFAVELDGVHCFETLVRY
ncbi:unnamed protein product [Linum tenue]|uniref:Uncharacterized protein n=1 Tax=Linum tenue TaxID=586396 RepID=A0AAV0IJC6_9ROSI|nr:unnamed protein product [Linum tenue]